MSSVLSQEWSNSFDPICDTQVKSLCPSRMVEQLANKLWSLFVIHMNNKVIILKLICDNNCYSRVILAGAEPNGLRGVPRNPGPNKILVLTMKTSPYRHPLSPCWSTSYHELEREGKLAKPKKLTDVRPNHGCEPATPTPTPRTMHTIRGLGLGMHTASIAAATRRLFAFLFIASMAYPPSRVDALAAAGQLGFTGICHKVWPSTLPSPSLYDFSLLTSAD